MKKGDIIYMEWDDHTSHNSDWTETHEVKPEVLKIKTVGFYVRADRKTITVSLLAHADNSVCGECMTILKSCITRMKKLKK